MKNFLSKEIILNNSIISKTGCWIWKRPLMFNGYGQIRINYIMWKAHRLSYTVFKGDIANNICVCHSCDVKSCVNPDHLWLGTIQDNSRDASNKGLLPSGERHYRAVISDAIIKAIRKEHTGVHGDNVRVGKIFNVNPHTISNYVRGISR